MSGLARGSGDGGGTALERGDALLEHIDGGVADAGIDVAKLLETEETSTVGRVVKDKRLLLSAPRSVNISRVDLRWWHRWGLRATW